MYQKGQGRRPGSEEGCSHVPWHGRSVLHDEQLCRINVCTTTAAVFAQAQPRTIKRMPGKRDNSELDVDELRAVLQVAKKAGHDAGGRVEAARVQPPL